MNKLSTSISLSFFQQTQSLVKRNDQYKFISPCYLNQIGIQYPYGMVNPSRGFASKKKDEETPKSKQSLLLKNLFDSKTSLEQQNRQMKSNRKDKSSRQEKSIKSILSTRDKTTIEIETPEPQETKPLETSESEGSEIKTKKKEKKVTDEQGDKIEMKKKILVIEENLKQKFQGVKFKNIFESEHYKRWSKIKDPLKELGPDDDYINPKTFGLRERGRKKYKDNYIVAIPPNSPAPFHLPAPPAVHDTSDWLIQPIQPNEVREPPLYHLPLSRPLAANKRHKRLKSWEKKQLQDELNTIIQRTRPTLHLNFFITQLKLLKSKHRAELAAFQKLERKKAKLALKQQQQEEEQKQKQEEQEQKQQDQSSDPQTQ